MNKIPIAHDLRSLLAEHKADIFASLNCFAIGKVQSFDSEKQTIKGSINYKAVINGAARDYPVLIDCPVIIMGGGVGSLRFPIAQGDDCLFFFNDRDIDGWYSGVDNAIPNSARMHSFSDALALIGPRSLRTALEDYEEDRTELVHQADDGNTLVSLKEKIKIANSVTDLKTVLDELVNAINGMTLTCPNTGLGPIPVTVTPITSNHGDLLES